MDNYHDDEDKNDEDDDDNAGGSPADDDDGDDDDDSSDYDAIDNSRELFDNARGSKIKAEITNTNNNANVSRYLGLGLNARSKYKNANAVAVRTKSSMSMGRSNVATMLDEDPDKPFVRKRVTFEAKMENRRIKIGDTRGSASLTATSPGHSRGGGLVTDLRL